VPVTASASRFAVPEERRLMEAVPETRELIVAVPDTLRLVPERACPKEWASHRNRVQTEPTRAAMVFLVISFFRR